jgi:long-chain acyl-CoA synthetase
MQIDQWQTVVEMFFEQTKTYGDKPFLWAKRGSGDDRAFKPITWNEAAHQVTHLAGGLIRQGVNPGDRIVLVAENSPEWCIADLAIMTAGAISVPAYTTNTVADHQHILENSGAVGAILSTKALAKNFLPAAHQSDQLSFVIAVEDPEITQKLNLKLIQWADALDGGAEQSVKVKARRLDLQRSDTACLIYTSGTGGAPKGVMLNHGSILHNCAGAYDVLIELGIKNERFLSFLPLSHAYEHSAGLFFPISTGSEIYFAEGLEKLGSNLVETKPTIMMVVPRLFEMLRMKITRATMSKGGLKAKLFDKTLKLGIKKLEGRLNFFEAILNGLLTLLVRKKVQQKFGGHMKALVSGGAPLNKDVGQFFQALGLRLLQGYGQTESAPLISVVRPSLIKMDTVGPPVINTEVKIADDGEILVKGELVMQGYWRDEEATKKTIIDGWLHTGDIGNFDDDGHIVITDRKKDIIVNDKGDNVSPQRIEGILSLEPEIGQAMVYGDKRPHLVGLIVPDDEWLRDWAKENGKPNELSALFDDADLHKEMDRAVTKINQSLSNVEKVRRFAIAKEPFSIDNAQMTPTLKVRRHVISAAYKHEIDSMY